jgi:hypothetical protein
MESANGKTLESAGLVSGRVKLRLAGSCERNKDCLISRGKDSRGR